MPNHFERDNAADVQPAAKASAAPDNAANVQPAAKASATPVPTTSEPALPKPNVPATADDASWSTSSVTRIPPPLLEHKGVLQLLRNHAEWAAHRVDIKYRPRVFGQAFYEVSCVDSIDCAKKRRGFYIVQGNHMHPPGTLVLQSRGEHSHQLSRGTAKLFTPEQLSIADDFVSGGGCDLRGLQRTFEEARILASTLPTPSQMSNWLKNSKRNPRAALSRHTALVEVGKLEVTAIPRQLPADRATLFLLEEPILAQEEVCILFS